MVIHRILSNRREKRHKNRQRTRQKSQGNVYSPDPEANVGLEKRASTVAKFQ